MSENKRFASLIAEILLNEKCIELSHQNPFTYASGLKGPLYCDNRKLLSSVAARDTVIKAFISKIAEAAPNYDLLCGVATAGIPHAAMIADREQLPLIYVRPQAKKHGRKNQIEGSFKKGDKVILIEDLINQGKSLLEAINVLQAAEVEVVACFSIVHYKTSKALEIEKEIAIPFYYLSNFFDIAETALAKGFLDDKGHEELIKWQVDPVKWSENFSATQGT